MVWTICWCVLNIRHVLRMVTLVEEFSIYEILESDLWGKLAVHIIFRGTFPWFCLDNWIPKVIPNIFFGFLSNTEDFSLIFEYFLWFHIFRILFEKEFDKYSIQYFLPNDFCLRSHFNLSYRCCKQTNICHSRLMIPVFHIHKLDLLNEL